MILKVIFTPFLIIGGLILMVHFLTLPIETDYWTKRGGFILGFIMLVIGGAIIWPSKK